MNNQQLKVGKYRHYKGKYYQVLDLVRHSETLEELVLYKALYKSEFGENTLWVRPKEMFLEEIEIDGRRVKRFEFISEND